MATEINGNGRPERKAGVYEHKGTGAKVYLTPDYELGSAQIDAFVQTGFVWVADKEEAKVVSEVKK